MRVPRFIPLDERTANTAKTDSDRFRGYGKIVCAVCGSPVRDHDIGPCPWGSVAEDSATVRSTQ